MAFTKEEFEAWHRAKLQREYKPTPQYRSAPVAICVSCQNPFGYNEGTITDEVAICDVCKGD